MKRLYRALVIALLPESYRRPAPDTTALDAIVSLIPRTY